MRDCGTGQSWRSVALASLGRARRAPLSAYGRGCEDGARLLGPREAEVRDLDRPVLVDLGGPSPLRARGPKRGGRHSEYAMCTVWRRIKRGPGG